MLHLLLASSNFHGNTQEHQFGELLSPALWYPTSRILTTELNGGMVLSALL